MAVKLIRSGSFVEAIELIADLSAKGSTFTYAPLLAKLAAAMRDGAEFVDVEYGGRVFKFSLSAANIGHDIHHVGGAFCEIEELKYCEKVIPKRSVIVDVGANTGNHVVFFSGLLDPDLVIPIEPFDPSIAILRRNLALNDLRVDERGLGLAAGRAEGNLFINKPDEGDLVLAYTTATAKTKAALPIRSARLDDLVPERVDFIKIDVEGFEDDVIAGCTRILTDDKPLLMVELASGKEPAFKEMISTFGYKPVVAVAGHAFRNVFFRVL